MSQHEPFLELLEPVQVRVAGYLMSMLRDRDDVKDVLGETILAAYEQFDALVKPDSFLFYMLTIARRKAKRLIWRRRLFRPISTEDTMQLDPSSSPDVRADIAILEMAMARLSVAEREAITLRSFSGVSIQEIALLQRTNVNTVKVRLHRGRRKLKVLLGECGVDNGPMDANQGEVRLTSIVTTSCVQEEELT